MIEATVYHQPVYPSLKRGVAAEIVDGREQLQERVLRDVHGHRRVARETKRSGEDFLSMPLKQAVEGFAVAVLTGNDEFAF